MREIAPGLWHWTVPHPSHGMEVSSYYLRDERIAVDVLLPPEGLDWFEGAEPVHILLTNRHHDRDAWQLREAFGSEVHCIANGVHELESRGPVTRFQFGDELPGGIVAHEVGGICPDETALHIPAHRALAVADGVVRWPGEDGLTFVPDSLMDDPEETKRTLREAYCGLLHLDFELLLLAHGDPVLADARRELRAFAEA
jgi:hypothetical protein